LPCTNESILIDPSASFRAVISGPEIIELRFYIIDIPPIPERLDGTQGGSEGTGGGKSLASHIVGISYRFFSIAVNHV
jgi:hypothetical protein